MCRGRCGRHVSTQTSFISLARVSHVEARGEVRRDCLPHPLRVRGDDAARRENLVGVGAIVVVIVEARATALERAHRHVALEVRAAAVRVRVRVVVRAAVCRVGGRAKGPRRRGPGLEDCDGHGG